MAKKKTSMNSSVSKEPIDKDNKTNVKEVKKEVNKPVKKEVVVKKNSKEDTVTIEKTKKQLKVSEEPVRSSRVERHKDMYKLDLSATKQQQFNFTKVDLDTTATLDTSFMEGRKKKVPVRQDAVPKKSLPGEAKNVSNTKKQGSNFSFFLLLIFVIILTGFTVYHFIQYNHSKVKVETKLTEKKVVDDNYLFLGDSITDYYDLEKYYKDLPVVNSGVSGNVTTDILDHMKERVYRYNPSKVFILIGTNDIICDKSNEEIVNNIKEIIVNIQKERPYCEIYLESIYPVNDTDDDKIDHDMVNEKRNNSKIKEINKELVTLAKETKITYIDMYDLLVDTDGNLKLEYTKDGLHMSSKGYEKITETLIRYIKK